MADAGGDKPGQQDEAAKTEQPEVEERRSKEITPMEILNMLTFITEMRAKKRAVHVDLEPLNVIGYGPREWTFTLLTACSSRLRVISTGANNDALVVIDPLYKGSFSNVDTLLSHLLACVDFIIQKVFSIYVEPGNITLDGALSVEPDALGIPLESLCAHELAQERIVETIAPFCRPVRRPNPNDSDGFVAEALNFNHLRDLVSQIAREQMRPLWDVYIDFERTLNLGRVDQYLYPVLQPNDHLNIIANPFLLNELISCLPMGIRYSADLIMELQCPEMSVSPVPPSQLLVHASQSTSKMTTLNSFSAINERPMMDSTIGFYMMSLLCPGTVQFSINLDDIPKEDIYLRVLAALSAKLLFSYNEIDRWNSLTGASVRAVDAAIVRAGLAAGVLEQRIVEPGAQFPLNNVIPSAQGRLQGLPQLQSDVHGHGWREAGAARFGDPPEENPYNQCQNRQLFVTNIDDKENMDEDEVIAMFEQWATKTGVLGMLSALSKGRVMRTPMAGMDAVMHVCAHRLFRFFIAVNHYNRENWYGALRPSEERAQVLYDDELDTPIIQEVTGRTILYMICALDENSVGLRRNPYEKQFELECGIMRDCLETQLRHILFQRAMIAFGIDQGNFSRTERAEFAHPKSGPLARILQNVRKNGLLIK